VQECVGIIFIHTVNTLWHRSIDALGGVRITDRRSS